MQENTLSQQELLALALEASRRGDSAHSLLYMKQAAAREDATPQAFFLLGSEYAQIGMTVEALLNFQRAVELDPDFAIARFQLGLLLLTTAQPDAALAAWAPLSDLGNVHPLSVFHSGLQHLIRDEFGECISCLLRGIELNTENPALNHDMQQIVNSIRAHVDSQGAAPSESKAGEEQAEGHLFLNAYTGGKVH
ncbi:hypothetical protein DBR47_03505 [Paucibacter sp. KBW04]|uniref:tetratricopeptide repeat protein n=1 Tax=Paucibacter sp. KBW04 TaxID=2153361 RepID=UPI000F5787FA|nr:tetratricopeptide repeat protein [Paucibacter sp. KBW04]RQO63603.1 hypothetical protein DBR47_03505 [Paucibacter sp. KBW04]